MYYLTIPCPCVLVIYCYIIKHSWTQWLKTATIYAAHWSVCWQFSLDLAVWSFWSQLGSPLSMLLAWVLQKNCVSESCCYWQDDTEATVSRVSAHPQAVLPWHFSWWQGRLLKQQTLILKTLRQRLETDTHIWCSPLSKVHHKPSPDSRTPPQDGRKTKIILQNISDAWSRIIVVIFTNNPFYHLYCFLILPLGFFTTTCQIQNKSQLNLEN